jgi:hypothetical protein
VSKATELIDRIRKEIGPGPPCRSCRGSGWTGFMGVALVACWRCDGSGIDPRPEEPESTRVYGMEEREDG